MEGILANDLIDLRRTSKAEWERIARTTAAALGSTRRMRRDQDVPVSLDVLKKNNIRFWFIIGATIRLRPAKAWVTNQRPSGILSQ